MRYTKLKVGFTIIVALIVLFGGVFWVKNYNPLTRKITLTILFENGRMITAGDPVIMSGIRVGEVTNVSLDENNHALVRFYMNYARLSPGTRFTIADVGLMGDKALVIEPGIEPGELNPNVIQQGTTQPDMSTLIANAGEMMDRFDRITAEFEKNVDFGKLAASFDSTVMKMNEAVTLYRDLAAENRKPIRNTIANLEATTGELKTLVANTDQKLDQAVTSFQRTSDNMSRFIDSLQGFPALADTMTAYLGTGKGTLGLLMKSDQLYNELRQTNADLDAFIRDIRENPGKYTKDIEFRLRLF